MATYQEVSDGHYVQDGWKGGNSYPVPPQIWGPVVRDNVVVSCADVVVVSPDGRILLARRSIQPLLGEWWVIGGKRNPGESQVESAERHFRRDTKLELPAARFNFIGAYSTVFAVRNEPPYENGSHTDNFTFAVLLTAPEIAAIKLDPREYEGENAWLWFFPTEIMRGAEARAMHPELRQIVKDLRARDLIPP